MKRIGVWLLLASLGVFSLANAAQALISLEYDLIILDLPAGSADRDSEANAINTQGGIVGSYYNSSLPIYWIPGGNAPFRIPVQYGYGKAFAISWADSVFGETANAIGWKRAFSWRPGDAQVQFLGYLPGLYDSAAYAPLTGCAYDHYTPASEQACYFPGDTAVALSPGKRSCALGMNGSVYVGWEKSERTGGNQHAVLWNEGPAGWQDLTPDASSGAAMAINLVIAVYKVTGYINNRAFIWDHVKGLRQNTDISDAKGLAINGRGQVVGSSSAYGAWPVAFIWEEGQGTELLNNLVANRDGFEIAEARCINDQGDIVGWGYYPASQPVKRAFLLRQKQRVPLIVALYVELLLVD